MVDDGWWCNMGLPNFPITACLLACLLPWKKYDKVRLHYFPSGFWGITGGDLLVGVVEDLNESPLLDCCWRWKVLLHQLCNTVA